MIRPATGDDLPAIRALWAAFEREIPPPEYDPTDLAQEEREIEAIVRDGIAFVEDRAGELAGFALATRLSHRVGLLSDLYVVPEARRSGIGAALVQAVAARFDELGVDVLRLEVLASNPDAQVVYHHWGFAPELLTLVAEPAAVARRLAAGCEPRSFGSVHVQTDDRAAVERAVAKVLPRLGRSGGTEVSQARNGWVAVYDELSDRDPKVLQRLARELSLVTGAVTLAIGLERGAVVRYALYDRGGVVDEYLSVPEYYGPLPPGDVVALGANPTVVARLTGADPARIRAAAPTGAAPAELPPPEQLLREIAGAMGVEGADRGWVASG